MDCFGTYFTHAQTCNVTRVQSATQWTAWVHTLHMPKPNVTRVQSATQWTASVHTLHMPKPNVTRVQSATQEENASWNPKKNLTPHSKGKNSSKRCTVGSANVPVWAYIYIPRMHPAKLRWNPKWRDLFSWVICRFHVYFPGCSYYRIWCELSNHGRKDMILWDMIRDDIFYDRFMRIPFLTNHHRMADVFFWAQLVSFLR